MKDLRLLIGKIQKTSKLNLFWRLITTIFSKIAKRLQKQKNKLEENVGRRVKGILLLFPLLAIFILLLTITLLSSNIKNYLIGNSLKTFSLTVSLPASYPLLSTVLAASTEISIQQDSLENLSAQAALIMDSDSKVILFSKNPDLRLPMASTVKIMTALVSLDYYQMSDILTVKENNFKGAVVGFKEKEKIYFENLLYGMLLPSGNDAAFTIAQNYPGGEREFVKRMNEKAEALYLLNTHFSDPAGLNEGNYTTPRDLARLSSVAISNKFFAGIVASKSKVITNIDETGKYSISNLNKLLGIDGINGIKTGFTEEAGEVLVTSRVENGYTFITVVMKSKDRFLDTKILLSLIRGKVKYLKFE